MPIQVYFHEKVIFSQTLWFQCKFILIWWVARWSTDHIGVFCWSFLCSSKLNTFRNTYPASQVKKHAEQTHRRTGWSTSISMGSRLLVGVVLVECLLVQPRSLSTQLRKIKQTEIF